ncbi:MAG: peptide chain release factor N(5)-glutamine methyltransferase [Myxococcota bacterium]
MEGSWTIRRVVGWMTKDFETRGLDSPRLDADLLVADALEMKRVDLYMDFDRPLMPAELTKIRSRVARRRAREPVAYILGVREFFGRAFQVSPAVLVPRPDTETLVEQALKALDEGRLPSEELAVLDLCTGSGVVGITIAAERPDIVVHCTDISPEALEVARQNAGTHGVASRMQFLEGDLFDAVDGKYALIAANPPYVADGDRANLQPEIRDHEPGVALFAGDDGLSVVRRIIAEAARHLRPGGELMIEIGAGQDRAVLELLDHHGFDPARMENDLGGIPRVALGTRPRNPAS